MNRLTELVNDTATECIVCLGTGGVGKTTVAAALAVAAARSGRRCLVITIDPALRLAQAIGVGDAMAGQEPVRVPLDAPGELWMHQLDPAVVFDAAMRDALAAQDAERVLRNPYYRVVADAFAGSVDYMAVEFIGRLRESDAHAWDLLIIDTAPAASALDFLDAPERLGAFTESRFVTLLRSAIATDSRRRLPSVGQTVLTMLLGKQLATGIAEFLNAIHDALLGMRERARETERSLQSRRTAFLVVTRPAPDQVAEAMRFASELTGRRLAVREVVINHVPEPLALSLDDDQLRRAIKALETAPEQPHSEQVADAIRLLQQRCHHDSVRADLIESLAGGSALPHTLLPRLGRIGLLGDLEELVAAGRSDSTGSR